jgi:DNA (cytosine-5)-methyltransferase 1
LDAQYFGVAQRRRRVFVVASARDDFDPAAVLLEWEGLRRDSAPSRETGKAVAPTVGTGAPFSRTGNDRVESDALVAQCLTTGTGQRYDPETETLLPCVFPTLEANDGKKWGSNQWVNQGKAIVQPIALQDVTSREKAQNGRGWNDDGSAYTVDTHATQGVAQPVAFQETADCLTAAYGTKWNGNASATNGSLFAAQPVAFHPTQDPISSTDGTTHAMGCGSSGGAASVAVAIAWDEELNASEEQSGTLLRGGQGGRHDGVMTTAMQVRRLTPVECERLQGFPDNYTSIPWRGKPVDNCPDGPRYKALGNSWAVPVVRWIGSRIQDCLSIKI